MEIQIREMQASEAAQVRQIGRPSFGLLERLVFAKPKSALVALLNDEIVGAASYKIFTAKSNQKVGYLETAYVKKGCEGKGIGSLLYRDVTKHLKENGCDTVTATVKDDNVASWKLFENNGFHITGFIQMLTAFGVVGAIGLWFNSMLSFALGFHLWSTLPTKSSRTAGQLGAYFLLTLFCLLPALFLGAEPQTVALSICAIVTLLAASVCGGAVATLFSKEKWTFRVANGGIIVSLIVTVLGGAMPLVARFYPSEYKRTPVFRRDMGLEGLFEWLAVLALVAAGMVLGEQFVFWRLVLSFGTSILLYHSLPFYPFECFGGKRIWDYSKPLSVLTMVVSAAAVYLI